MEQVEADKDSELYLTRFAVERSLAKHSGD